MKSKLQYRKKVFELMIFMIIIFLLAIHISIAQSNTVTTYFFFGKGCPHCAQMEPFLDNLKKTYPSLEIKKFEVYFNQTNRDLFEKVAKAYNTKVQGVPALFIDNKVIFGYNNEIAQELEKKVNQCFKEGCISPEDVLKVNEKNISIKKEDFSKSEYKNTQEGLSIFIILILLFFVLLFSIIMIKRKRGEKK